MSLYTRHSKLSQIFIGSNGLVFNTRSGKMTRGQNSGIGYRLLICDGSKTLLHREIALMYLSNPEDKPQVNHINGDRSDNRIENLEWATASENMIHRYKVLNKYPKKSFASPNCKVTPEQVEDIRSNPSERIIDLALKHGISRQTVRDIRVKRTHQ